MDKSAFRFGRQRDASVHRIGRTLLGAFIAGAALASDMPDLLAPKDFVTGDQAQAELGQLLSYGKIPSGNRSISCGTCRHHEPAATDRLSLGIGEGGAGLGPERSAGAGDDRIRQRIPRNAPALRNLGHGTIKALFHDGRLSVSGSHDSKVRISCRGMAAAGPGPRLAAQALFPVASEHEMAGNDQENEFVVWLNWATEHRDCPPKSGRQKLHSSGVCVPSHCDGMRETLPGARDAGQPILKQGKRAERNARTGRGPACPGISALPSAGDFRIPALESCSGSVGGPTPDRPI